MSSMLSSMAAVMAGSVHWGALESVIIGSAAVRVGCPGSFQKAWTLLVLGPGGSGVSNQTQP